MNYLKRNVSGITVPAASPQQSSGIHVDAIHKTHIYNQSGTLSFQGYVPADFQITLQSQWGPMFPTMSVAETVAGQQGAMLERAAGAAGASSKMKVLSAQMWEGPAYLELSLPIHLIALRSTKDEVIKKLQDISLFVTPGIEPSGVLVPPGPVPLGEIASQMGVDININEDQLIVCQLGKWFRMTPCIVTSVTAAVSSQPEHETGNPMTIDLNVELRSYFAVTKDDIRAWLKGGFGS